MPTKPERVVWAPKSKNDLLDIWRYYGRIASPEVADKFLRDLSEVSERLVDEALMWRARDEVMPGLRSIPLPPYLIFYRIIGDVVEVVRVLHERRNLAGILSKRER